MMTLIIIGVIIICIGLLKEDRRREHEAWDRSYEERHKKDED